MELGTCVAIASELCLESAVEPQPECLLDARPACPAALYGALRVGTGWLYLLRVGEGATCHL